MGTHTKKSNVGRAGRASFRGALRVALVATLSLMAAGCTALIIGAAAGAGAVGVAYVRGGLKARVAAEPRAIQTATLAAFDTFAIRRTESKGTALDAKIIGQTALDKTVTVKVNAEELGGSALSIRIGAFGDEKLSRKLFHEIVKNLPNDREPY